jgi:CTP synthase (UTP-ammonia lyase)
MTTSAIAIVGDFAADNRSHLATNAAIEHCSAALGLCVESCWVGTEELAHTGALKRLAEFDGFWIGPGSPYQNAEGALLAIRAAREGRIPLLGTCGGFQHVILEYARNVLGLADAAHEETEPGSGRLVISRLACSLAGRSMTITLEPGTLVARTCGRVSLEEQYRCNFGVNPEYAEMLHGGPLLIAGSDSEGVVRAVELAGHPFFVGTLFLPQLSSTPSAPHPLICGFLRACGERW